MAGGVGSRFWPLSRTAMPKQFLDILDIGKTFIQMTYERFLKLCLPENIFVVTHENYKDLVLEQLPQLSEEQILLEPIRRNTAPCIAYANWKIEQINPEANIIVAPSDHLIFDDDLFIDNINNGFEFVSQNDVLLTLGIKPIRPETAYGYIQMEQSNEQIRKVKVFTEKPNVEMARMFFVSGDFLWNSGIFIWSLKSIKKAFTNILPDVHQLFFEAEKKYNNEAGFIQEVYSQCPSISIDYGLMEKADNVHVLYADFKWTDLGTWDSLYALKNKDNKKNKEANVISGKNVLTYETTNTLIKVPEKKLVIVDNLENYLVVDTEDVLLICKRSDEQRIRKFLNEIKMNTDESYF